MDRKNFLKLIGADSETEYAAVAFLTKSGYAGLGYFNASVNEGFTDICVFLSARLVDLGRTAERGKPTIRDFNEFIEEVVVDQPRSKAKEESLEDRFGDTIPIVAIPMEEFAVVYPVSQIRTMIQRSQKERGGSLPTFFNLGKSEILSLLRVKLW